MKAGGGNPLEKGFPTLPPMPVPLEGSPTGTAPMPSVRPPPLSQLPPKAFDRRGGHAAGIRSVLRLPGMMAFLKERPLRDKKADWELFSRLSLFFIWYCHSIWLFYFNKMLKTESFFKFSTGGLHDWGILLVIPLAFQEMKHQPLPMTQPLVF